MKNKTSHLGRQHVWHADLKNTWLPNLPSGEQRTEIEIVGENYEPVLTRILKNFRIGCGRTSQHGPMNTDDPTLGKEPNP